MKNEILFTSKNLNIEYDINNKIIYSNWKGYQTIDMVKSGCEQILIEVKNKKVRKVLNDNTNVVGPFKGDEWAITDWFPRMFSNGVKYFAWILSTNIFSQLSVDKTISKMPNGEEIQTFNSLSSGKSWLEKK